MAFIGIDLVVPRIVNQIQAEARQHIGGTVESMQAGIEIMGGQFVGECFQLQLMVPDHGSLRSFSSAFLLIAIIHQGVSGKGLRA